MKKTELMLLGKSVRRLREQSGLSQEALADLSHLHRTYIGGIERGERNVGLMNLLRLSKALKVLPSELLENFDKKVMSAISIEGDEHD
ncbi:MAG: helix-turn-helix transcriptional regulator [Anaerolineales bacterium]|jgi:transcriptional regulator with XRE-family HTH domain|nr:helix-turn-helix transcriptional regulator [Anaerolineales bacterium]